MKSPSFPTRSRPCRIKSPCRPTRSRRGRMQSPWRQWNPLQDKWNFGADKRGRSGLRRAGGLILPKRACNTCGRNISIHNNGPCGRRTARLGPWLTVAFLPLLRVPLALLRLRVNIRRDVATRRHRGTHVAPAADGERTARRAASGQDRVEAGGEGPYVPIMSETTCGRKLGRNSNRQGV